MITLLFDFFGTIVFFSSGFFVVWFLFSKLDLCNFIAYLIISSISISTIISFFLFKLNLFNYKLIILLIILFDIFLLILILFKNKKLELNYNKVLFFRIFFISLFGTLWRFFFDLKINSGDNGYGFFRNFLISQLNNNIPLSTLNFPDIGFYTGMLLDHSEISAGSLTANFYNHLALSNAFFETFLSVFIFAFFVYYVIYLYRKDKKLAFFSSFIVAGIAPFEIWFNTFTILNGQLSYVALISLFILLKKKNNSYFYFLLMFMISMSLTYYTINLVIIIVCFSFMMSILFFKLFEVNIKGNIKKINNIFRNTSFFKYLIIVLLILFLFFTLGDTLIEHSSNTLLSAKKNYQKILSLEGELNISEVTPFPIKPYQNKYKFLRISPLNWQNLFFLLIGFTFLIFLYYFDLNGKKLPSKYKDIFIAILPAFFLFIAFTLVNYPQRAFSYLLFFMFLIFKYPKSFLRPLFFIILFLFLITSYFENIERITFLDNSIGEIKGAKWLSTNINGRILSDLRFINLLLKNGYYNVTGFPDNSKFMEPIYYDNNITLIQKIFKILNIDYFVTTKRMREQHILMLNFPQEPMNNSNIYQDNFEIVYNNDDVIIYDVK